MTGRINEQGQDLGYLMRSLHQSTEVIKELEARENWMELRSKMEAFSFLMQVATQHQLHMHMLRLVDLQKEWGAFRQDVLQHGWETAVRQAALFSYWREEENLVLAIHVPM